MTVKDLSGSWRRSEIVSQYQCRLDDVEDLVWTVYLQGVEDGISEYKLEHEVKDDEKL